MATQRVTPADAFAQAPLPMQPPIGLMTQGMNCTGRCRSAQGS